MGERQGRMGSEQGQDCHDRQKVLEFPCNTWSAWSLGVRSEASAAPPVTLASAAHMASLRLTPLGLWYFPSYPSVHLAFPELWGLHCTCGLPFMLPHITTQKVSIRKHILPYIAWPPDLLIFKQKSPRLYNSYILDIFWTNNTLVPKTYTGTSGALTSWVITTVASENLGE